MVSCKNVVLDQILPDFLLDSLNASQTRFIHHPVSKKNVVLVYGNVNAIAFVVVIEFIRESFLQNFHWKCVTIVSAATGKFSADCFFPWTTFVNAQNDLGGIGALHDCKDLTEFITDDLIDVSGEWNEYDDEVVHGSTN